MANNRNEPRFEEVKTRITEIVSTMSESELEKFQTGLEEWRTRKDLSIFAFFWLGDYYFRDYIKNISAGGLFIETNVPATVGGTVTISFGLLDNKDPIQAEGKIDKIDPNGFGVKFNEPLSIHNKK
jgi:hypothetical protein